MKHSTGIMRLKLASDPNAGEFEGYGSVFGVRDSDGDIVLPGAFKQSLSKQTPKLLWQHDRSQPIGVWTKCAENSHGLHLSGQLNLDVQKGREALALLKQDASLLGLSIGYFVPDGGAEIDRQSGVTLLKEVDLWEVSLVTFAANQQARITGLKSGSRRDFEQALRKSIGFSARDAKRLSAEGWKGLQSGDDHSAELKSFNDHVCRNLDQLGALMKSI